MDFFAPLCSSCGECTWRIERVSAASPVQGSRLVVLVVVIVASSPFYRLYSIVKREPTWAIGHLSLPTSSPSRSHCYSSLSLPSSPFDRLASVLYPILLFAALCSSPFLLPNSLLNFLISFFRRIAFPQARTAELPTSLDYLPDSLLSSPSFSFFFQLFIFHFISSFNLFLVFLFFSVARSPRHLKTFFYSFVAMK